MLQRHYSYECNAKPQERPYVPRPSRTQQLLNPDLVPKLTTEVPDDLTRKKGVADEELARKEAERQRKRELEADDEPISGDYPSRRRASSSCDSVSTISTRSPSPAPRRCSPSPAPARRASFRGTSPTNVAGRRRSFGSSNDLHHGKGAHRSSPSRISSPRRRGYPDDQSRASRHEEAAGRGRHDASSEASTEARRDRSVSSSRHSARRSHRQERGHSSRSPSRSPPRNVRRPHQEDRYRDREDRGHVPGTREPPQPPRERSLSPFSKRLALTQAMNMGR